VSALRVLLQLALYLPLVALIGWFSSHPEFRVLPEGEALLRVSIVHATQRLRPCRERSPEELAKLAPNMRAALDCPRERAPLALELELDGAVALRREVPPAGLRRDGAAALYHRMTVPAGAHRVVARLRERAGPGFDFEREVALELAPGASLVIDFNAAQGGFLFKG